MKIAVVGAGVFGCTAAIKLAEAGHKITLFEREKSILSCASGINQYRLHKGYHYPRSKETVGYVKESSILFEEEFPSAICKHGYERYYAIPHEGSLVSPSQYLEFMETNGLEYQIVDPIEVLRNEKIALTAKVQENGYDLTELYILLSAKLAKAGVNLRTNHSVNLDDLTAYDLVVNATYANINSILLEEDRVVYQYELCEKPVVNLSEPFIGLSVVVIDGEFCCIDPFGFNHRFQVMGHVKEAIHDRSIGYEYKAPKGYELLLNKGRVFSAKSKFDNMWKGFREYFNADEVAHRGSMYTVRTVLPQHEHDDARPSNIIKHSDRLYSIFSGKVGTCVDIANKLVKQI